MGIGNLLPLLGDVTNKSAHISHFRGKRLAIDSYSWLHKAAYAASGEIALGITTSKWQNSFLRKVQLLLNHGIIPVMVFDGAPLPAKLLTEGSRSTRRAQAFVDVAEALLAGNKKDAEKSYARCVDITPSMAAQIILQLRQMSQVEVIVAPNEADSQLAFLSMTGYVDAILSEDSDLLIFGCKKVLYKLDYNGSCESIELSQILRDHPKLSGFTLARFRQACILSGCDYISNIEGIGLIKSIAMLKANQCVHGVLRHLRLRGDRGASQFYENEFSKAEIAFRYQRVYDPISKTIVFLNPLPLELLCVTPPDPSSDVEEKIEPGSITPVVPLILSSLQSHEVHYSLASFHSTTSPIFPNQDLIPTASSRHIQNQRPIFNRNVSDVSRYFALLRTIFFSHPNPSRRVQPPSSTGSGQGPSQASTTTQAFNYTSFSQLQCPCCRNRGLTFLLQKYFSHVSISKDDLADLHAATHIPNTDPSELLEGFLSLEQFFHLMGPKAHAEDVRGLENPTEDGSNALGQHISCFFRAPGCHNGNDEETFQNLHLSSSGCWNQFIKSKIPTMYRPYLLPSSARSASVGSLESPSNSVIPTIDSSSSSSSSSASSSSSSLSPLYSTCVVSNGLLATVVDDVLGTPPDPIIATLHVNGLIDPETRVPFSFIQPHMITDHTLRLLFSHYSSCPTCRGLYTGAACSKEPLQSVSSVSSVSSGQKDDSNSNSTTTQQCILQKAESYQSDPQMMDLLRAIFQSRSRLPTSHSLPPFASASASVSASASASVWNPTSSSNSSLESDEVKTNTLRERWMAIEKEKVKKQSHVSGILKFASPIKSSLTPANTASDMVSPSSSISTAIDAHIASPMARLGRSYSAPQHQHPSQLSVFTPLSPKLTRTEVISNLQNASSSIAITKSARPSSLEMNLSTTKLSTSSSSSHFAISTSQFSSPSSVARRKLQEVLQHQKRNSSSDNLSVSPSQTPSSALDTTSQDSTSQTSQPLARLHSTTFALTSFGGEINSGDAQPVLVESPTKVPLPDFQPISTRGVVKDPTQGSANRKRDIETSKSTCVTPICYIELDGEGDGEGEEGDRHADANIGVNSVYSLSSSMQEDLPLKEDCVIVETVETDDIDDKVATFTSSSSSQLDAFSSPDSKMQKEVPAHPPRRYSTWSLSLSASSSSHIVPGEDLSKPPVNNPTRTRVSSIVLDSHKSLSTSTSTSISPLPDTDGKRSGLQRSSSIPVSPWLSLKMKSQLTTTTVQDTVSVSVSVSDASPLYPISSPNDSDIDIVDSSGSGAAGGHHPTVIAFASDSDSHTTCTSKTHKRPCISTLASTSVCDLSTESISSIGERQQQRQQQQQQQQQSSRVLHPLQRSSSSFKETISKTKAIDSRLGMGIGIDNDIDIGSGGGNPKKARSNSTWFSSTVSRTGSFTVAQKTKANHQSVIVSLTDEPIELISPLSSQNVKDDDKDQDQDQDQDKLVSIQNASRLHINPVKSSSDSTNERTRREAKIDKTTNLLFLDINI